MQAPIQVLNLKRMFDAHLHLRRGGMLLNVLPFTTRYCSRAVIMGNTLPPIKNAEGVIDYRKEILAGSTYFEPIMSIMLLKSTTPEIVEEAYRAGARVLKLIPGGTSTNSDEGVPLSKLRDYYNVLDKAQELGMIFSVHFELSVNENGEEIPEIQREQWSIDYLFQIARDFLGLRIVVEHVSTMEMIEIVKGLSDNVFATLTVHHATRNYFQCSEVDGMIINPINYCKPIFKRIPDMMAVAEAMVSGNPKFFLGSDSAPHLLSKKCYRLDINQKPAAGLFTAPVVPSVLCDIFVGHFYSILHDHPDPEAFIAERINDFASNFGADAYGLSRTDITFMMVRSPWVVPREFAGVGLFMGGEEKQWQIRN